MSNIKTLNTNETMAFINGVVEQCFKKAEDGSVEYYPHLRETAIRLYTIQMYGGIPYDGETDVMGIAYGDTYREVEQDNCINYSQLLDIESSIDAQIEWTKQKLLKQSEVRIAECLAVIAAKKTPFEEIDKALSEVVTKLGEKFDSVDWDELAENVKGLKLDPEVFVKELMDKKYPVGE